MNFFTPFSYSVQLDWSFELIVIIWDGMENVKYFYISLRTFGIISKK